MQVHHFLSFAGLLLFIGCIGAQAQTAEEEKKLPILTSAKLVQASYIGWLNRAPANNGMRYWMRRDLPTIHFHHHQAARDAPHEDLDYIPHLPKVATLETEKILMSALYHSVLGRAPDQSGLHYWAGKSLEHILAAGNDIAKGRSVVGQSFINTNINKCVMQRKLKVAAFIRRTGNAKKSSARNLVRFIKKGQAWSSIARLMSEVSGGAKVTRRDVPLCDRAPRDLGFVQQAGKTAAFISIANGESPTQIAAAEKKAVADFEAADAVTDNAVHFNQSTEFKALQAARQAASAQDALDTALGDVVKATAAATAAVGTADEESSKQKLSEAQNVAGAAQKLADDTHSAAAELAEESDVADAAANDKLNAASAAAKASDDAAAAAKAAALKKLADLKASGDDQAPIVALEVAEAGGVSNAVEELNALSAKPTAPPSSSSPSSSSFSIGDMSTGSSILLLTIFAFVLFAGTVKATIFYQSKKKKNGYQAAPDVSLTEIVTPPAPSFDAHEPSGSSELRAYMGNPSTPEGRKSVLGR